MTVQIRKLLATIVFFYSVNSYSADWKEVSKDLGGDVHYIDLASIKKVSGRVYYTNLIDFFEEKKFGVRSHVGKYGVDCLSEKQIWLSNTFFSQPMATGNVVTKGVPVWNHYGSTLNETRGLAFGSIEFKVMKYVCDIAVRFD